MTSYLKLNVTAVIKICGDNDKELWERANRARKNLKFDCVGFKVVDERVETWRIK